MTTNQQLKLIIADNNLINKDISDLLGCSLHAVDSWTCDRRTMPDLSLKYLILMLKEGKK